MSRSTEARPRLLAENKGYKILSTDASFLLLHIKAGGKLLQMPHKMAMKLKCVYNKL